MNAERFGQFLVEKYDIEMEDTESVANFGSHLAFLTSADLITVVGSNNDNTDWTLN